MPEKMDVLCDSSVSESSNSFLNVYDDFDISIPSISIPSSLANITIHNIPKNKEQLKKGVSFHEEFSKSINYKMYPLKEIKRGRKKKYDPDMISSELQQTIIDLTRKNVSVSKLAQILNSGYIKKQKFNPSIDITIEAIPKIDNSSPSANMVVELDPSHYFPDEPHHEPITRRRKKQDIWDRMPHKCNICQKGFKNVKGLQLHKRTKHDIEDLSGCYPCENCIEVFWMKRDLLQHVVTHQDKNGRLPCPENCGVTEPDVPSLARHKACYHPYLGTLGRNWFHTWCDK